MKKVYYKGEPFEFSSFVDGAGTRKVLLMKNNNLVHFIDESELDSNPVINIIRNFYYNGVSLLM